MNKSELIEELSVQTGHNPKLTDKSVRIFFDRIKDARNAGDKVEIRGFGSFTLKNYKSIQKDMTKNNLPTNKEFIIEFNKSIDDFK